MLTDVASIQNLKGLMERRKEAGLSRGSFLRKGEVFAYVGRVQTLKDLEDSLSSGRQGRSRSTTSKSSGDSSSSSSLLLSSLELGDTKVYEP